MKHLLPTFLFLLFSHVYSQETLRTIRGSVSDGQGPLEDVNISIKNTDRLAKTDQFGKYEISAREGETLVYSHVGKETLEILVEDVTTFLNVALKDEIQELEEVVVTKRYRKTQNELRREYDTNKDLIKTIHGIMDTKMMTSRVQIIDERDINPSTIDILTLLRSRVPNILAPTSTVGLNLNDIQVFFRRGITSINTVTPVMFEVDGILLQNVPTFIDIQNIDRMAVIQGLGALNKYGSNAAGGLVIINTKTANFSREPGKREPYDQAKLRDNFFEKGDAIGLGDITMPIYLRTLRSTINFEEAKESYTQLEKVYGRSPYFYLDTRSYFRKEHKDRSMVEMITSTIETRYSDNPVILKALAYQMDEEGDYRASMELYKKIFVLRPHYQQSYHDLANAYRNNGKIERAALLYARHQFLLREGFFSKSDTFSNILNRDFNNLVGQEGEVLSQEKVFYVSDEDDFNGTRLVFEWNDGEAEFELQFVNGNKQYYTFKHTGFDNEELIKDEKQNGFSCQEYLIYDPKGIWQVNVNYLGNKSLAPTYIKATVYQDYGKPSQRQESKVFKLMTKNRNQELFRIQANGILSIR
ncbi:carboxypeptidase-like regulatory domain-containing protein [Ulvibacterium marinum]|uniref:carboxypeptidase-like regulatory domain-containing protein n=1 Tax=Ulvibacterium marinum TaxID=2419782 RepID=UPI0024954EA3|nr:carboxypeptidase-like regulatory domain-containing protein [Ulvibacterium marinum]